MAHNHQARARRNRGSWYAGLQADHANAVETLTTEDLQEFDAAFPNATLVALDHPAPSRGYALLALSDDDAVHGRIHVIAHPRQSDDAYRALFSHTRVQADILTRSASLDALPVLIEREATAEHVAAKIEELGEPYLIRLHTPGEHTAGPISEAIAEQIQATGGVTIDGNTVSVTNTDGSTSTYGHATSDLQDGDTVQAGDTIGTLGAPANEDDNADEFNLATPDEYAELDEAVQADYVKVTIDAGDHGQTLYARIGSDLAFLATDGNYTQGTWSADAGDDEAAAYDLAKPLTEDITLYAPQPKSETTVDGSTEIPVADKPSNPWEAAEATTEIPDTQCPECGQEFSQPRYVKQHRKAKHPEAVAAEDTK